MKAAITLDEIFKSEDLKSKARDFYRNVNSLKEFGNYSTERTFIYLFGQDEGPRLWRCFVIDAERSIWKLFFEYLTNEQKFILSVNLSESDNLRVVSVCY